MCRVVSSSCGWSRYSERHGHFLTTATVPLYIQLQLSFFSEHQARLRFTLSETETCLLNCSQSVRVFVCAVQGARRVRTVTGHGTEVRAEDPHWMGASATRAVRPIFVARLPYVTLRHEVYCAAWSWSASLAFGRTHVEHSMQVRYACECEKWPHPPSPLQCAAHELMPSTCVFDRQAALDSGPTRQWQQAPLAENGTKPILCSPASTRLASACSEKIGLTPGRTQYMSTAPTAVFQGRTQVSFRLTGFWRVFKR